MQPFSPPTRRLVILLATALLLAGTGCAVGSEASSGQEEPAPLDQPEGRWSGSVTYSRFQGTPLLSVAYTASGDFWFDIDDEGQIRGRAVVAYQPTVDLGGLNAVLSEVRGMNSAQFSALPLPFPIPPQVLSRISSDGATTVRGWYHQPQYTVRGEITGVYDEDETGRWISLEWAQDPEPMELTVSFDGFESLSTENPTGSYGQLSELTTTELAAASPWSGPTELLEDGGTLYAEASDDTDEEVDGVTVRTGSTWSAARG